MVKRITTDSTPRRIRQYKVTDTYTGVGNSELIPHNLDRIPAFDAFMQVEGYEYMVPVRVDTDSPTSALHLWGRVNSVVLADTQNFFLAIDALNGDTVTVTIYIIVYPDRITVNV